MKRLLTPLNAIIILLLSGFLFYLSGSGHYWRFLNPKFMPLTEITAWALLVLGLGLLNSKVQRISATNLFCFACLMFLALWAVSRPLTGEASLETSTPIARLEKDGRQYIRINLAELNSLCQPDGSLPSEGRYAARGLFLEHGDGVSGVAGIFVRPVVFCCLADAINTGFVVETSAEQRKLTGQWVQVCGLVRPRENGDPAPEYRRDGHLFTVLNQGMVFQVEHMVPIPAPMIPYIFEIREREPFAY